MILPITTTYILAASGIILWQCPRRSANRVLFAFGIAVATWYASVQMLGHSVSEIRSGQTANPTLWIRVNAMVASLFPWLIAFGAESITSLSNVAERLKQTMGWLCVSLLLFALCAMPGFTASSPISRGPIYYAYSAIGFTAYLALIADIFRRIHIAEARHKVDLQFASLVPAMTCIFGVIITTVGNAFFPDIKRLSLVAMISCFTIAAWAMTSHRIYAVRQVFLLLVHRLFTALGLGLGLVAVWHVIERFYVLTAELIAMSMGLVSFGLWFDGKIKCWLGIDDKLRLSLLRAEVIELSRKGHGYEALVAAFEELLRRKCDTKDVTLLAAGRVSADFKSLDMELRSAAQEGFAQHGWASPESIVRQRSEGKRRALLASLLTRRLGLVIFTPRGSSNPSLILALGTRTNGWPYTTIDIERLQNVAELIDNALTHSRLSSQAALRARMEHLAMMSRGLAHDLKNLITPVSSFLVHAEGKIAPDTVEAEVHAAAKRSVRIMNDYIREALVFANRLEPHFEIVSTGKLFDAVRELTASRANWRKVKLVVAVESDHSLVGDAVLLQRVLGNLVANAIDASPPGKIVSLSAVEHAARGLRISVVDQGSGIAPEHLSRIFEPYFTTKEFGDEVRGFGLGLTISQKIVHLHHGTISAQSQLGCGTAITIDLPFKQPSSKSRMTEVSIADTDTASLSSA